MGGGNQGLHYFALDTGGLSPRGRGKPGPIALVAGVVGSIPAWAGETRPYCPGSRRRGVYPRVGGGNAANSFDAADSDGLSPRGRGKRRRFPSGAASTGSIPAWAGETTIPQSPGCPKGVYPRVGGGNLNALIGGRVHQGLSPRGRGKPVMEKLDAVMFGSIPAWAGETSQQAIANCPIRVYPRVGGGNAAVHRAEKGYRGLSPRGRGKRRRIRQPPLAVGSIPAWAGETRASAIGNPRPRVYPRVGGGNMSPV